jgi:site-specific DNA-methyltransferase (adenine-specific)
MFQDIKNGRFYLGDCLEVMKEIPDGVIDMILTDPPYGTTACKWDSIIPFDAMWLRLNKLIKQNGAIVLFGSEPFSSALRMSNIKNYKYDWVWNKERGTNFLNFKYQPAKAHEMIMVFGNAPTSYTKQGNSLEYNPQMEQGTPYTQKQGRAGEAIARDEKTRTNSVKTTNAGERYPKSYQFFKTETGFHPTQKPVALMEYLIKTYTNEGEIVLDFTAGSGTTAIAAENTGRKWVCIEQSEEYATKAVERIVNHEMTLQEKPTSEVQIDSNIPIPEGGENGN